MGPAGRLRRILARGWILESRVLREGHVNSFQSGLMFEEFGLLRGLL